MRPAYRVGQVAAALRTHFVAPDESPAERVLPPSLLELFRAMPLEDRGHGLVVLAALEGAGETAPPLLQAALLHDLGKAQAGVRLVHRVARVLLAKRARWLWRYLAGTPTGWRRPFWAVANHPSRGAVWIATHGGSAELVELVRYHEAAAPMEWGDGKMAAWHAALAAVDAVT